VLYSDAYMEASPLLVGFSIFTLVGVFFANRISVMVLFPLNRERTYLYLCSFNGVLNVVLNIALIPRYGILGAVIATGGSSLIISFIEFIIAVRIIRARPPVDFILVISLIMAVSISPTLFIKNINMLQLATMAIIYGIIVTFFMFKFYTFGDREKEILQEAQPGIYAFLLKNNLLR
jgi:O-antigen/teichoic acid export membrane protein